MTPYEERLCRTCQYGKKSEYQKPCVVYWDDCQLYRPIEEMTTERAIEILKGAIKKPNTKDGYLGQAIDMAIKALEQKTVLDNIKAEILDEAEYAYADFDRYKEDILHAEPDELPDDDFRYGLERAVEIINKYKCKAESENEG